MKNQKLEFNIHSQFLDVLDFTWLIKRIDAVYVAKSKIKKGNYAICIQYGSELIELYYTTKDELNIVEQFKVLSNALKKGDLNFNFVGDTALVNYANIVNIKFADGILDRKVVIDFGKKKLVNKHASRTQYDEMVDKYNDLHNDVPSDLGL